MSDTFCTYGEAGALYGGDDYGECGLRGVRSCASADDPETTAEPMDPACATPEEC